MKKIDFDAIEKRLEEVKYGEMIDLFEFKYREVILEKLPLLLKQAKIMSSKYDICCTNPPYLGRKSMNKNLSTFLDKYYSNSKFDLFSAFIERGFKFTNNYGYNAIVTSQSWMFLSSYQKLRKEIINSKHVSSLVHIGNNVWGNTFGTVALYGKL